MAFRLFRGLAHGLHQLNHDNIVHGDLKPDNLILDRTSLVIIDFGSSWTVENSVMRLAGDGRTDGFASPEQHAGESLIDFRSDQFSATALFFLMLTGDLPYAGLGGKAGRVGIRHEFESRLDRPSELCRDRGKLPEDFWQRIDDLVLQGLAFDPNQRFGDSRSWIGVLNEIDARLTLASAGLGQLGLCHRMLRRVFSWFSQ
jgi:serine/threonine protein kinase